MAENISELRKADELGNLYTKSKSIENKGLFFLVLDNTVLGKEFKIVNGNENLMAVGDVNYGGSFVYMVELHFLDSGWVKGEYRTTVKGICNSYNNTAYITYLNTVKTRNFPYTHINAGVWDQRINGNQATIIFAAGGFVWF